MGQFLAVAVFLGLLAALIVGTKPDCSPGHVAQFTQYNGWLCVAGHK